MFSPDPMFAACSMVSPMKTFNLINSPKLPNLAWKALETKVRRLQKMIAVAYNKNDMIAVQKWQRILTTSFAAQMLAMRAVVKSSGIASPGVDGLSNPTLVQFWMLADLLASYASNPGTYEAAPVRRVWIPKNVLVETRDRPLGVPNVIDRCVQTLYLLALDPIAESTAESRSFGFRKGLGVLDALGALRTLLAVGYVKPQLIFDADISKFFDSVSHQWLLANIPLHMHILTQFLKAGFIDKGKFYPTTMGFPQGGNISPTIANMVLDGLMRVVAQAVAKAKPGMLRLIHSVRYADDFVVVGPNASSLFESIIIPAVNEFLAIRGLSLNLEKSKLLERSAGFDFLGFHFQWVANMMKPGTFMWLVTPTEKAIKIILRKIDLLFADKSQSILFLLQKLNPVLQGWASYYKVGNSSAAFKVVESYVWNKYLAWCVAKYPRASKSWIIKHCFLKVGGRLIPCYKPSTPKELRMFDIARVKLVRLTNPVPRKNIYLTDKRTKL